MTLDINKYILGLWGLFYPLINSRRYRRSDQSEPLHFFLSFDCDYSKDIMCLPELLELLDKANIKASFACIGRWIEKYPKEHRLLLEGGHEILNHTHSHPSNKELNPDRTFSQLSNDDIRLEIEQMHKASQKILGYTPVGFRLPHFGSITCIDFNYLFKILLDLGYKYDSSILDFKRSEVPDNSKIREFLISTCPQHPFTAFDTYHFFRSDRLIYKIIHKSEQAFTNSFNKLLKLHKRSNMNVNVYFDPADIIARCDLVSMIKHAQNYGFIFSRYCDMF